MKKGIVMEVKESYVVMLTPEGEFLKAKKRDGAYEIGEEISFFPLRQAVVEKSRKRFAFPKFKPAYVSVFAALFLLLSFLPFYQNNNEVYAYMSIDINPSFEMSLDQKLNVILLEALNEEAIEIIDHIPSWENQHVDVVTSEILNESQAQGYLDDGKEVLITTVMNHEEDEALSTTLKEDLKAIVITYEKQNISVTSVESTVEVRERAKEQGVTTGKLLLIENKLRTDKDKEEKEDKESEKKEKLEKVEKVTEKTKDELKEKTKEKIKGEIKDPIKERARDLHEKKDSLLKDLDKKMKKSKSDENDKDDEDDDDNDDKDKDKDKDKDSKDDGDDNRDD
ncbi:anti-sigma factor domain-containing protein [Bacillus timonensis]|nr:anti-sigma factor domain-containing protein [Bacillus timonensis]